MTKTSIGIVITILLILGTCIVNECNRLGAEHIRFLQECTALCGAPEITWIKPAYKHDDCYCKINWEWKIQHIK